MLPASPRGLRLLLAIVLLIPVAAGCIGASEDPAGDASQAQNVDEDDMGTEDLGEAEERLVVREHTLFVEYYARAASVDTQNMEETNWEIEIPANVTEVRAKAEWEPSTPFAEDQALMLHEGSKQDAGEMFGEPGLGSSPIQTPWTQLPEDLETVTIMCHVYSSLPMQPAGVAYEQETELTVEFR